MRKVLGRKEFNYNGLEIIATDVLVAKEISNHGAFVTREWAINGKAASVMTIKGEQMLTQFNREDNSRLCLKGFQPDIEYFIPYSERKSIVELDNFVLYHSN